MRKAVALVALLVLASAATLASGAVVRAPGATTGHAAAALGRVAHDVHAVVTLPERGADWATTQSRGPHANDALLDVLDVDFAFGEVGGDAGDNALLVASEDADDSEDARRAHANSRVRG